MIYDYDIYGTNQNLYKHKKSSLESLSNNFSLDNKNSSYLIQIMARFSIKMSH